MKILKKKIKNLQQTCIFCRNHFLFVVVLFYCFNLDVSFFCFFVLYILTSELCINYIFRLCLKNCWNCFDTLGLLLLLNENFIENIRKPLYSYYN